MFYFAILANVTPPVAGATLVGSKMAGGNYMKASWESLKLSVPFYLVPFFIAKNPIILSRSQPFSEGLFALLALLIACGALLVFCQNVCFTKTGPLERILFLLTAFLATCSGYCGSRLTLVSAVLLFGALIVFQWKKRV